jgi:hypothetical protein
MPDVLKTRRQLRRVNRDLCAEIGRRDQREEHYAKAVEELKELRELYDTVTRTMGTIESDEVAALKRIVGGLEAKNRVLALKLEEAPTVTALRMQVADLTSENALLASKLEAALAAVGQLATGTDWDAGVPK